MIPNERDRIIMRIQAGWPRPAMGDATLLLWSEHLSALDYETCLKACGILERTNKHQPTLADLHEAYGAARTANPLVVLPSACVECEDGWVGYDTVSRCPNGCMPPTREEREERRAREDREWFAQRRLERSS